ASCCCSSCVKSVIGCPLSASPASRSAAATKAVADAAEPVAATAHAATAAHTTEQSAGQHCATETSPATTTTADEKQDNHEKEGQPADQGRRRTLTRRPGRRTQRIAAQHLDHGFGAGNDPALEVASAKRRSQNLVDDDRGLGISQAPFQPVAHLDPHAPVIPGNNQQRAIVLALLTYAPFAAQLYTELLNAAPLQIGHRYHHNLLGGRLLMAGQHLGQLRFHRRTEQLRLIDHPASQGRQGQFRGRLLSRCTRSPAQQPQRQQPEPPHSNCTCGACSAFSVVASKFSRIGISLYIRLCQMRPGKVRISVLYCCTAPM